jgi:hypothetical protein
MANKNYSMDDMGNEESSAAAPARAKRKGGKMIAKVLFALAILIIAGVAIVWCAKMFTGGAMAEVSGKDWQAVFLTNGQVYFGKVTNVGKKTITLADIYYLQVVTKPLQTSAQGSAATATDQTQQELTLIKLGNELHGPTDKMIINGDQVLLTEKLKNDSRVVQAIDKYVADQKAAATK